MSGRNPEFYCRLRAVVSAALTLVFGLSWTNTASASPWAEVGDAQLRSDIQVLAAAGVVDGITTHWPIPWAGVLDSLRRPEALEGQPENVQAAVHRVWNMAEIQLASDNLRSSASTDIASLPSVVRAFDGMGRADVQTSASLEYLSGDTAVRLSVGGQYSDWRNGQGNLLLDGSYIAQKVGNALVYVGDFSHWWGPGWISALSLSNNARPFPQIGIERLSTSAFEDPWLSWIGPWQAEFLVGWLDGPRIDKNTLYNGLRVTFNPLPGLEIGLARTQEFCGEHHSCDPIKYYFEFQNDSQHVNHTNDEGVIDVHYTTSALGWPFEIYTQVMNEDSNPITHSGSSHLFGSSLWIPFGVTTARVTAEYTDSIATADIFSFGDVFHGVAYNNGGYPDGMRYRGRTLGFSLDSDSRLASLQTSWQSDGGWAYTISLHRAWISTPQNTSGNAVTTAPVIIDFGEARIKMPFEWATVEVAARLQDDQPRPAHGFTPSIEASLGWNI